MTVAVKPGMLVRRRAIYYPQVAPVYFLVLKVESFMQMRFYTILEPSGTVREIHYGMDEVFWQYYEWPPSDEL